MREPHASEVSRANAVIQFIAILMQSVMHEDGGLVLENPLHSYLWMIFCMTSLMQYPTGWFDVFYDACCLGGARCKHQRLRTNIAEMRSIECQCRHIHAPEEWEPMWDPQSHKYLFKGAEEAEYTADLCFMLAVQASWWAVRSGRAGMPWARRLDDENATVSNACAGIDES